MERVKELHQKQNVIYDLMVKIDDFSSLVSSGKYCYNIPCHVMKWMSWVRAAVWFTSGADVVLCIFHH